MSESATVVPEHILCDTSFISVVQAALRRPDATEHWPDDRRARLDTAILAMSVVSLAELRSGHIYVGWGQDRRERAEALMGAYVWVPLDMEIVDVCAELRAEKKKRGWGLGDNDCWVAATAMSRAMAARGVRPALLRGRRLGPHLPPGDPHESRGLRGVAGVSDAMPDMLRNRLRASFRWSDAGGADPSGWWMDADLRAALVEAVAEFHAHENPTVVVGVPTKGYILGALVAQQLGVGFVEVRKDRRGERHGKGVLRRTTPPDYAQRGLTLTMRSGLIGTGDRVVLADDWIETGAQATAVQRLTEDAGAHWVGVGVIVDATTASLRRALGVRSLLSVRELYSFTARFGRRLLVVVSGRSNLQV